MTKRKLEKEFIHPAKQYGLDVLAGKYTVGKLHKRFVERHFYDLEHAVDRGFYFDEIAADRVIQFFSFLHHSKGKWKGESFKLEPWQQFIVYVLFGWMCEDGTRRFRLAYNEIARKNGKALEVNTPVFTKEGWKKHGDLKVGDFVFSQDGKAKRVQAVTEHYLGECYKLFFSNQTEIIAHENHEWETLRTWGTLRKQGERKKLPLVTTKQIFNSLHIPHVRKSGLSDLNHSIKINDSLILENTELKIPPYTFGMWLGDGHSAGGRITTADLEVIEAIKKECVPVKKGSGKYSWSLSLSKTQKDRNISVAAKLRELKVLNDKHIPKEYLLSSISQRLELLAGLVDSDGHVSKNGQCEICIINKKLADSICALIRSLGYKVTVSQSMAKIYGRDISERYRISFYPSTELPLKIPRKKERLTKRIIKRGKTIKIKNVVPVGKQLVNCIQVEGGFYLAGDGLVKTHNSTLASGIALYLLIGDGEGGAEVYSAATKKDQAKIVFLESKRMVQASPALKQRIDVQRDNLNIKGTASKYEPLSSDEDSLDGLNVHGAIVDELHAHKTRAVFDVLDTATGSREQPLIFCITTAGFNKESIAMNLRNYGERVLNEFDIENGVVDDTFFVFIASLDQEDDWQDEKVWVKANPNLGVSVNLKDLQTKANKAKQDPGSQNSFRCKHLNEWTSQEFRYIPMDKWDLGKKEPSFTGEAFGGLDLAKTTDLCSWKLIFPQPNGEIHVKSRFWIPEDNVREKSAVDRIDYIALAQQGFITLVPGATIDYTWIFNAIDEDLKKFNIKEIGFDRYGAESIVQKLDDLGAVVVPVGQGMASMSAPTKELLKYVLEGKIIHGGHPILRWNADNMIVTTDDQDNIKPSKKKSRQKIDGIVALIIALDRFMRSGSGVSVYEEREILTL